MGMVSSVRKIFILGSNLNIRAKTSVTCLDKKLLSKNIQTSLLRLKLYIVSYIYIYIFSV